MIKYGVRFTGSLIPAAVYLLAVLAIAYYLEKLIPSQELKQKYIYYFTMLGLLISLILIMNLIPQTTRVGRLPAVNEWLSNFSLGIFPYRADSNPSGFPFLFFFIAPFYLLGDVGYFEVFGLILFILILINSSRTRKEISFKLFFLFVSLPIYYELFVRSELLANIALVIAVVIPLYINLEKRDDKISFWVGAVIFGALLSTRLIVFVLLFLFLMLMFRQNLKKLFLFGLTSLIVFLLTLVPFYLWDQEYFVQSGPFSIQLIYLPNWAILISIAVIVYIGMIISNLQEYFFTCGLSLFALTFVSMMLKIIEAGFNNALFKDHFDISYFIFSLPFFILSLEEYKHNNFLGRVYPFVKP